MKILKGVLGFVPFIVFSVLVLPLGVQFAAWLSVTAAAVVVLATARGGIQIAPAAQGVILFAIAVLSVTGGPGVEAVLTNYGAGFAALVLGLFLVATAASMPFTAQVSRSTVPPEVWHSPLFLQTNRRISTAWGMTTIVMGLSHLAAAEITPDAGTLFLRIAVTWVLPLVGCLLANGYTQRVIKEAHQQYAHAHEAHQKQAA